MLGTRLALLVVGNQPCGSGSAKRPCEGEGRWKARARKAPFAGRKEEQFSSKYVGKGRAVSLAGQAGVPGAESGHEKKVTSMGP